MYKKKGLRGQVAKKLRPKINGKPITKGVPSPRRRSLFLLGLGC